MTAYMNYDAQIHCEELNESESTSFDAQSKNLQLQSKNFVHISTSRQSTTR